MPRRGFTGSRLRHRPLQHLPNPWLEASVDGLRLWHEQIGRTIFRNPKALQFWDAVPWHPFAYDAMPQIWRERSSSRARVPSFKDPRQICLIWGACRNATWSTFNNFKLFGLQKQNDLKVADVPRWEGVTLTFWVSFFYPVLG
jgi:hypothetical protein